MANKNWVWAIDENGKPCKCTAKPENRGKRNCKHIFHQEPGQSSHEFFEIHNNREAMGNPTVDTTESITQDEIDDFASRLDEICGCRVTKENYKEVLESLTPHQIDQLNKLGFEAAPSFSLPISDENYEQAVVDNKIYFADLPEYGIGGKKNAMRDMFGSIGAVPTLNGEYEINGNYRDGLSARDYFEKQFSTRGSQVQKTVSVSAPGHAVYCEQELVILDGNENAQLTNIEQLKERS